MALAAHELLTDTGQLPLGELLRPKSWDDFVGLGRISKQLVDMLRSGSGRTPSLVLWGPPGSGKTSLARLIGKTYACRFVEFSAVLSGVKEVRDVVEKAKTQDLRTLLFVDEIHRFNKAQQDAFLPHVENGAIALIGATTENPSFYLTGALLSRLRVIQLKAHTVQELMLVAERAERQLNLSLSEEQRAKLCHAAGGDARQLLVLYDQLANLNNASAEDVVEQVLSGQVILHYDRSGDQHYQMASAFIKSMRGSDPDAALYWAFRMIEAGEDARFIIRRMMIFASEDIGNADPRALTLAVSTAEAFDRLGLPEGKIPIAQCITYLASVPKSNRSYAAMKQVLEVIADRPSESVPKHLCNAPTKLMKELGMGADYQYAHDFAGAFVPGEQYLPTDLVGKTFYHPSEQGLEKSIAERLARLRASEKK